MSAYILSEINIYPIKSLGGISLKEARVQDRGLAYDRRWMLVDENGNFLTQRQHARMALLQVHLEEQGLLVTHKKDLCEPFFIPFEATSDKKVQVTIWEDTCTAAEVSEEANTWFSNVLEMPARLVLMPTETERKVDQEYAHNNEVVSFSDGYPFLLIGQASLDDLNNRLTDAIPMDRFRPNFVFTGGKPFEEDDWDAFQIGEVAFRAAKPCARCVVTTIDQASATKSLEPLKTLSTYRLLKNKVMFGQNLLHSGSGVVRVGDELVVNSRK